MHLRPTQFDGRADAPVRCHLHRPVEGNHGYPGSHLKPPLGKYSHPIAPADDRVRMQTKKTMKKHHTCRSFCWPWRCTGTIPSAWPDGGGPGLLRKQLVAATGRVGTSTIAADRMNWSRKSRFFPSFFIVHPLKRGLG